MIFNGTIGAHRRPLVLIIGASATGFATLDLSTGDAMTFAMI